MNSGGQYDKVYTYYSIRPGATTIFNLVDLTTNEPVGNTLSTTVVQTGTPSLLIEPNDIGDDDKIRIRLVGNRSQHIFITKTLENGTWSEYSYVNEYVYYPGLLYWKIKETTVYDNVWIFIKDPTKSYGFALRNGMGGDIIEGTEIII